MKRKRNPLQGQVVMLQQIIGALVARHNCHVELSQTEIDGHEGDRMEMNARPDGVTLTLHRTIRVMSSLN